MIEGASPWSWAAVVINENAGVFLHGCLTALTHCDLPPADIVVVDNASTDDSVPELAGWPKVAVEGSTAKLSLGEAANRGIGRTDCPLILLIIPDVEVDLSFGRALRRLSDDLPDLGVAAPKVRLSGSDVLRSAGALLVFPHLFIEYRGDGETDQGQWDERGPVDASPFEAMVLRRVAWEEVGGFDESYYPGGYEDMDLSLRMLRAGWRVLYDPELTATLAMLGSPQRAASVDDARSLHRNRLHFAVNHLSRSEWWNVFLPAEIRRLRSQLSGQPPVDWPIRSGADAIEELARTGFLMRQTPSGLFHGEPLAAAVAAVDEVRRQVESRSTQSGRSGLSGWLRRAIGGGRADLREQQQEAVNLAVLQALEAQDRLNRELVAELLLVMLDSVIWQAAARANLE